MVEQEVVIDFSWKDNIANYIACFIYFKGYSGSYCCPDLTYNTKSLRICYYGNVLISQIYDAIKDY